MFCWCIVPLTKQPFFIFHQQLVRQSLAKKITIENRPHVWCALKSSYHFSRGDRVLCASYWICCESFATTAPNTNQMYFQSRWELYRPASQGFKIYTSSLCLPGLTVPVMPTCRRLLCMEDIRARKLEVMCLDGTSWRWWERESSSEIRRGGGKDCVVYLHVVSGSAQQNGVAVMRTT